jgi:hypothetical protein
MKSFFGSTPSSPAVLLMVSKNTFTFLLFLNKIQHKADYRPPLPELYISFIIFITFYDVFIINKKVFSLLKCIIP